jgi:hypothetical protein
VQPANAEGRDVSDETTGTTFSVRGYLPKMFLTPGLRWIRLPFANSTPFDVDNEAVGDVGPPRTLPGRTASTSKVVIELGHLQVR